MPIADLGALCQDMADIRSSKGGRLAIGTIMGAVPDMVVPVLNVLRDEPLSEVAGYHHPPFDEDEITLRQLKDHRWLVYLSRMPLHTLLEREMDLAGMSLPVNQIATASTFVTIAVLQRSTDIVALLPTDVADFFERHRIVRILPIELRSKHQTFGIVTRKGGALSPAANQFIQLLRDRNMVH